MHVGHYISGAGHLALLGWALFGNVFAAEPLPFEMTDVSIISGEEYAALVAGQRAPDSTTDVEQPSAPEQTEDAPEVDSAPDPETVLRPPQRTDAPEPAETPPEQLPEPPPQADVSEAAPELPEPPSDLSVPVPDVAESPTPRAADRVAPEPVAQPEPDAAPDPVEQEAVTPDAGGETETREAQEATAPEEAATEIVTEAEKPARAPDQSPRPPARRPEPAPQVAETPEPEPEPAETPQETVEAPAEDTTEDAVADALAEALSQQPSSAPSAPSGPPMTAGEKESLRVAVSNCWNVGSLSSDALKTTVVVSVAMNQDATPITGSIRMLSQSGGTDASARQAFEAARRAIIRCGAKGFALPPEKYGHWQEIEMTFNPERMRVK
ncbi:energy transducer TonB [Sulfitobacter sp. D35]|uniref:energy transducer TonB n=1 Tax=Sulfitobacter sp. D35 TaxID=3083252 RepID=UPI00296EA2B0|nr:energy transducer TonB [Sulfitobacter sp. D35]MDW4499506.1 energy transducer TonB [Sulfitobacter sp. D35]